LQSLGHWSIISIFKYKVQRPKDWNKRLILSSMSCYSVMYSVLYKKEAYEKLTEIYLFAPVIRANSWLSLVSHGGKPISVIFLRGNGFVVGD
jgi:hypothetical protein